MRKPSQIRERARRVTRLEAARRATESVGAALLTLRGQRLQGYEGPGGQLKTVVDQAAQGWVLAYLRMLFPEDRFLCEERNEDIARRWDTRPGAYWTIDALDGTRSFVEGFEGFCVQVAYIEHGQVQLGVVHEPVRRVTYWAETGRGAFRDGPGRRRRRLMLKPSNAWPTHPVFVDSRPPHGAVRDLVVEAAGRILECGSIGLKICRVADGTAHVFAKALAFGLWDVAPGDLILGEAGGRLGVWTGDAIPYDAQHVVFHNLLAAPRGLFQRLVKHLAHASAAKESVTC